MSKEVRVCRSVVREATLSDIDYLSENIRECDKQEIWAMSNSTPHQAFLIGYNNSDTPYVVELDGKAIAMFGVSGRKGDVGIPWMLATDGIKKMRKEFLIECKPHLEAMHKDYPLLTNFVWEKNTTHIVWLKWLGFTFGEIIPLGVDGENFIQFYKVKLNV